MANEPDVKAAMEHISRIRENRGISNTPNKDTLNQNTLKQALKMYAQTSKSPASQN
jgi:hypothetical protein